VIGARRASGAMLIAVILPASTRTSRRYADSAHPAGRRAGPPPRCSQRMSPGIMRRP
jgi:hypothetical protein